MVIDFKSVTSLLMCFLLFGCFGDEKEQLPVSMSGQTMGTTYNITIVDNPLNLSKETLKKRVDETLAEINSKMSNWYDQSEISSVNSNTSGEPIDLSHELFDVINIAKDINIKSNGAFDVTSAPLINLWGFGPKKTEKKIPTESEVNKALELVGQAQLLKLISGLNQLKKTGIPSLLAIIMPSSLPNTSIAVAQPSASTAVSAKTVTDNVLCRIG